MAHSDNNVFAVLILINTILWCIDIHAQSSSATPRPSADTFDIRSHSFFLPQAIQPKKYLQNLSFTYVDLPASWTLNQINAPMLTYRSKFGLPAGFLLESGLSTIGISNRLSFGPSWNFSRNHLHFGIGWQAGYSLGLLNSEGFKTHVSGWDQEPYLCAGRSFRQCSIIIKASASWTNSDRFTEGGHRVPMMNSFFNGYSLCGVVEQRLHKGKVVCLGIKLSQIRYHFLAWPAFPVNQSSYYVPEFQISINL